MRGLGGLVLACVCLWPPWLAAEVVVLTNATSAPVRFHLARGGETFQPQQLDVGGVASFVAVEPVHLQFVVRRQSRQMELAKNAVYAFVPVADTFDLQEVSLPGQADFASAVRNVALEGASPGALAAHRARLEKPGVVPVKIYVDDDEAATDAR